MKYYSTSLDQFNLIFTPLVLALVSAVLSGLAFAAFGMGEPTLLGVFGLSSVMLLAALCISFLFRPKGYRFEGNTFYIRRAVGDLAIDLSEIKNIKQLSPNRNVFQAGLRIFGAAGFFGYYGYFWNRELGKYILYANNLKNPILITTYNGGFYMVSPDEPDLFFDLSEAKLAFENTLEEAGHDGLLTKVEGTQNRLTSGTLPTNFPKREDFRGAEVPRRRAESEAKAKEINGDD